MESANESDWTLAAVRRFGVVCPGAGILELFSIGESSLN